MPFSKNVKANNTMIPAAALITKPCWGLEVQLKICMGKVVYLSKGPSGINGTYTNAPTTINGAVSPIALDIDRITPVNIPPQAAGNTIRFVVCHFVAPMPKEASLNEFGTALIASLVATIIIGIIKSANVKPPARILFPKPAALTKICKPRIP